MDDAPEPPDAGALGAVTVASVDVDDITPAVLDVAALLRARTKDSAGHDVGTFTDDTRPTSAQVVTLARSAALDVQARLGPNPPAGIEGAAKGVATVLTAMMVELSYFPEQVASDRSPYMALAQLFDTRLKAVTDWAGSTEPGARHARSLAIPVDGFEEIDEDGRVIVIGAPWLGAHFQLEDFHRFVDALYAAGWIHTGQQLDTG